MMTDLSGFIILETLVRLGALAFPPSPSPTLRSSLSEFSHPGRLKAPVSSAGPEKEIATSSLLTATSTSLGGREIAK